MPASCQDGKSTAVRMPAGPADRNAGRGSGRFGASASEAMPAGWPADRRTVTEICLSERRDAELATSGLIPLVHRKNSDVAAFISAPSLQNIINAGNKVIPFSRPDLAVVAIALVARRYLAAPPEAQFHILVSPLVTWIWSGGIIVFLGALVAMWPAPRLVRRSVTVSARAVRGLARA